MKRFIHRHQMKVSLATAIIAGLGAALIVAFLWLMGDLTQATLLMAPFGASCVLLFAAPHAPLSQPMNVVGGHVLAALIGLSVFALMPVDYLSGGLAVGASVAAMAVLRLVHPPAGATALVAATAKGWGFLFLPVLTGSLALVAFAVIYHRLSGVPYPAQVPKPESDRP